MNLPETCKGCGRCCEHFPVIPVMPGDAVPDALLEHDPEFGQWGMIRRDGACIAYDRTTRTCTIYAIRPTACREVDRGDDMCVEALGGEGAL